MSAFLAAALALSSGTAATGTSATPPTATSAIPATSTPPKEKDHFDLYVSAEASTDDNLLQQAATADRVYLGELSARLRYRHRWTRSWFRLEGHGNAEAVAEHQDLSRIAYGGQAFLALSPSRRTSLTAYQTFDSSYTRDLQPLADLGVVLPYEVGNLAESGAHLVRLLSRPWTADLGTLYRHLEFPSGRLADGEDLVVVPGVRRALRHDRVLSFAYEYEEAWSPGFHDRAHGVVVGLARNRPRGIGYDVQAGAAYIVGADTVTPVGAAEVSVTRKKGRASARYDRQVQHALGLGRQVVTDAFGLSGSRSLGRRVTVRATGTFGINADPLDPQFRYRSGSVAGDFDFVLASSVSGHAGCTHMRIDSDAYPSGPSTRCSVSLGYRAGWR